MVSNTLVTLSITNRHYNPVNIYWQNPEGDAEQVTFHRTLTPGESYQQASFTETLWIFKDLLTGVVLNQHIATADADIRLWVDTSQRKQRQNGLPGIDAAYRPERDDNQFALMFDGENDIVIVPGTGLNFGDHFTLEAWIYRLSAGAFHPILDKTDGQHSGYFLRISADDTLQGGIRRGNTEVFFESTLHIESVTWTHVAITIDVDDYEIKGYINGELAAGNIRQQLDRDYRSNVLDLFEGRFAYMPQIKQGGQPIHVPANITFEMWVRPVYDYDPSLNQKMSGLYPGQADVQTAPFTMPLPGTDVIQTPQRIELDRFDETPSPFGDRVFTIGFGYSTDAEKGLIQAAHALVCRQHPLDIFGGLENFANLSSNLVRNVLKNHL